MSQPGNAVTSSSKEKRQYRKGNPLTDAEKQRQSVARKRALLKEVKVFLDPQLKGYLLSMCEQDGLTQAEVLTTLIEREAQKRKLG
ncbi:putative plasmid replication regulatory protein [Citrobacter farmeri GTC 1319]|uniref:replication regulatory protein RepA n=1 Tax=Citrobacter farmeri TaxID=67824 RepID=UPI00050FC4D8|nr:replication regulatory protein RepA [Citrobacter farmeri]QXA99769.1 replication regulatory protein RepA [Citrobacter farmeri]GAL51811.1 putative plasmid replication regulatory protein [Citrobacter farmeri GTC 1319]